MQHRLALDCAVRKHTHFQGEGHSWDAGRRVARHPSWQSTGNHSGQKCGVWKHKMSSQGRCCHAYSMAGHETAPGMTQGPEKF